MQGRPGGDSSSSVAADSMVGKRCAIYTSMYALGRLDGNPPPDTA